MANKQQTSLSLSFVAVVVILLTSQAKADTPTTASVAEPRTGLEDKDDEILKDSDGVITDPRLEDYLQDMIEMTEKVLRKSAKVGRSEMVKQCNKEFTFSLENLNKAMELYRKGVRDEAGFKELTALVTEAGRCYKRCDKGFAVEYKPSPFSSYDKLLYRLSETTGKRTQLDAART